MRRLLSSYFLPFIPSWTGYHSGKSLHLPTKPMLSSLWSWASLAINPTISLYCVCYSFVFLFTSYYPVGLWANVPAVSTYFFINPLLRASLAYFPCLYLFWACWPTFLPCQPVLPHHLLGFLGPFNCSLPLLLPWACC